MAPHFGQAAEVTGSVKMWDSLLIELNHPLATRRKNLIC
jgi:hypothetical protein